ncbi:glycine cleavage system protein GcvH [candidate division WOR-3 bacterium]|nr:glycine cleavage system protein GcvH [candidate division WOR-3 bacterium]
MKIIEDLKYTKTHEWVKLEEGIATCGITDYAQSELSDIVFVEFNKPGTRIEKGKPFGTIEAVKSASDLYAPLSGEIIEVNEKLSDSPDLVNSDPYGKGWMVKIKMSTPDELNDLLDAEAYKELLPE